MDRFENMDGHPVLYHWIKWVIVLVPKESEIIPLVLVHCEAVEHLADVTGHGNVSFPEAKENAEQVIGKILSTKRC